MLVSLEPNNLFVPVVRLQHSATNMDFREFIVQGRVRTDNSPAGTFGNGTNYQYACDGNVSFCLLNTCHTTVITLCRLLPLISAEMKKLQLI